MISIPIWCTQFLQMRLQLQQVENPVMMRLQQVENPVMIINPQSRNPFAASSSRRPHKPPKHPIQLHADGLYAESKGGKRPSNERNTATFNQF